MRPNQNDQKITLDKLANSHWQPAELQHWCQRWDHEVAQLPTERLSRFFLIQGLLLPVWDKLRNTDPKVYRLTTDDGQSCLGRFVNAADMAVVAHSLGLGRVQLSATDLYQLVLRNNKGMPISDTLRLKRSLVMGSQRIEVVGDQLPKTRLKHAGCFSEIIRAQKRWFIPAAQEEGIPVLETLLAVLR